MARKSSIRCILKERTTAKLRDSGAGGAARGRGPRARSGLQAASRLLLHSGIVSELAPSTWADPRASVCQSRCVLESSGILCHWMPRLSHTPRTLLRLNSNHGDAPQGRLCRCSYCRFQRTPPGHAREVVTRVSEIPGAAPAGAGVAARAFPPREAPPRSGLLSGFTRSRITNIVVLSRQRRLPQTGHWTRAWRGRARHTHCAGWPPRLLPSGIIRYELELDART